LNFKQNKMDAKKLISIYDKMVADLNSNPGNVYDNFKAEWSKLNTVEQEVLKPFVGKYHTNVVSGNTISIEKQMYLTEIIVMMNLEYEGQRQHIKLNLSSSIKDVQIAKLFYDLKDKGYIENNYEDIATAVSNIFDVKFETMFSYLNNPARFDKAIPLFNS
jgi:hypothetical protein